MNDMGKMGAFLFVIASVAGLLLAVTEFITKPRILRNRQLQLQQAKKDVLPQAAFFYSGTVSDKESNEEVEYTAGFCENRKMVGLIFTVSPSGYAGPINMVLGIDKSGDLSGISVLSHTETPGLGSKIEDKDFISAVINAARNAEINFGLRQDGGDVDAITAATISSKAFLDGVMKGKNQFAQIKHLSEYISAPEIDKNHSEDEEGDK